jgi:hypothetical protein
MSDGAPKPFNYLPPDLPDLERLLGDDRDDLIGLLEEEIEGCDRRSVFIDADFEMAYPEGYNLAMLMAHALAGERTDGEAINTAYRSLHFAYNVGDKLLVGGAGLRMKYFFDEITSMEQLRQKLVTSAAGYYAMHASLDVVSARFADELDPTGRYGEISDIVTGVTFMFIEESARQSAIKAETEAFSRQLGEL